MTIQQGQPLSKEDVFLISLAQDSIRTNLQLSNEILKQLLTLSGAILGSGVIFLTKETIPAKAIAPVLSTFLLSLISSLLGVLPYKAFVNQDSPENIKSHKQKALRVKLRYIRASASFLLLGLLASIVLVAIKAWPI